MDQSPLPSVRQFVWDAYQDWATLMSGALTVPFTAAAIFLPPKWDYVRGLFGTMAVLSLSVGSYRLWADERRKRIEIERHLAPRLRIEFDPTQARFMHPTRTQGNAEALYVRVAVRALSPTVENCRGFLQKVSQWNGEIFVTLFDEPLELPWSNENPRDIQASEINIHIEKYLDVAWFIAQGETVGYGFLNAASIVPNRFIMLQQREIDSHPERNLKLDIVVVGKDSENAHLSLNIRLGQGRAEWNRPQVGWMDGLAIRRDKNYD